MTEPASSSSETNIPPKGENTWAAAETGLAEDVCAGMAFVRSNPVLTVLGALAVGVILGCLASHHDKPTPRERYVDEPLEDLRALARSLRERASHEAVRGSDAAAGALDSILKGIKGRLKF